MRTLFGTNSPSLTVRAARLWLAVCCLSFVWRPVQAQNYTFTDLHPPGVDRSEACSVSGSNQVGFAGTADRALMWSGTAGSVVDLTPSGFTKCAAQGISGTRQVGYGSGTPTGSNYHALLWSGTAESVVDLNPSGYSASYALGISGNQQVGNGFGPLGQGALLWFGTAESAVDLNPIGFTGSHGLGISGSQQVGRGYGPSTENNYHALLWTGSAESVVDLNPAGFTATFAQGTSGSQQAGYGYGSATSYGIHALLWSGTAESYVDLNPSGFTSSHANAASGNQQVGDGAGPTGIHALLWSGTAESHVDLHDFLPPGYNTSYAQSIDANGNIAGLALDTETGQAHAVLWTISGAQPTGPLLGITRSGQDIVLSWPTNPPPFTLQSASSLNLPVNWVDCTNIPVIVGAQFTVTITVSGSGQVYRLKR